MAPAHDFVIAYEYAVIAIERAAGASHQAEDDKEEWVDNVEELLIGRSFWDMWPTHMREAFMRELRVVQDKEYLVRLLLATLCTVVDAH